MLPSYIPSDIVPDALPRAAVRCTRPPSRPDVGQNFTKSPRPGHPRGRTRGNPGVLVGCEGRVPAPHRRPRRRPRGDPDVPTTDPAAAAASQGARAYTCRCCRTQTAHSTEPVPTSTPAPYFSPPPLLPTAAPQIEPYGGHETTTTRRQDRWKVEPSE
jgi:hypothetical protein